MGITVLPNYGEEAGRALSQLGKGLSDIINPHNEFQTAMTKLAAENPEVIQRLADQEALAPGSVTTGKLSQLLPKHILSSVINTPQSYESQLRARMSQALTGMDPATREKFLQARAVGTTPEEQVTQPIKANAAAAFAASPQGQAAMPTVGAKAVTGETPAALVKGQIDLDAYQHGLEFWNGMSKEDKDRLGLYGAFPQYMQDANFRAEMDYHWQVFNARDQDRRNDSWTRMEEADAIRHQDEFKTVVPNASATDWEELLFNPATRDRINKLAETGGAAGSEHDKLLLQMRNAWQAGSPQSKAMSLAVWSTTIHRIENEINGTPNQPAVKDSQRGLALIELNRAVNAGLPPGAPKVQAIWGPAPPQPKKGGLGVEDALEAAQRSAGVGPGKSKLRYVMTTTGPDGKKVTKEVSGDELNQLMSAGATPPAGGGAPTPAPTPAPAPKPPAAPPATPPTSSVPPDSLFRSLFAALGGDQRMLLDSLKSMGYYGGARK